MLHRQKELERIKTALLVNNCSLIVSGEEGSGKSTLCEAIIDYLTDEELTVVTCCYRHTSFKTTLQELAVQLGISIQNSNSRNLTINNLKLIIEDYFQNQEAIFLIIDDACRYSKDFRTWLTELHGKNVRMLLFVTTRRKTDIFTHLPCLTLEPLHENQIKEIIEETAQERGIVLNKRKLAKLQKVADGNPLLAINAVKYKNAMSSQVKSTISDDYDDYDDYMDATPLVVVGVIVYIIYLWLNGFGASNRMTPLLVAASASTLTGLVQIWYKSSREV